MTEFAGSLALDAGQKSRVWDIRGRIITENVLPFASASLLSQSFVSSRRQKAAVWSIETNAFQGEVLAIKSDEVLLRISGPTGSRLVVLPRPAGTSMHGHFSNKPAVRHLTAPKGGDTERQILEAGLLAPLAERVAKDQNWLWRRGLVGLAAALLISAVFLTVVPILGFVGIAVSVLGYGILGILDYSIRGRSAQNPQFSALIVVVGLLQLLLVVVGLIEY